MKYTRLVTLDNIYKHYINDIGVQLTLLYKINFNVIKGNISTILAPAKSGLSTLLRILANIEQPDLGTRTINPGTKVLFIPATPPSLPWLSNTEKILFKKKPKDYMVRDLLENVNLDMLEDYFPRSTDSAIQLRLTLAKCIHDEVDVLIMDDAFSSIREEDRFEIMDLFRRVIREKKFTVVMGSRNLTEALCLSDRITLMTKSPGKLIQDISLDFSEEKSQDIIRTDEFYHKRKFISEIYRTYDDHFAYRFST